LFVFGRHSVGDEHHSRSCIDLWWRFVTHKEIQISIESSVRKLGRMTVNLLRLCVNSERIYRYVCWKISQNPLLVPSLKKYKERTVTL